MAKEKINTQAIGLDAGLGFIRWLTGAENLHYGLWTDLEPNAENLGAAQSAYTAKLFGYLPQGPLSILDVGGGAGETAKKLIALGHSIEIVVPSPLLAERCRENAPEATVHEMPFEDFQSDIKFDLCLFSESFQYIPMDLALDKALKHVKDNGHVLIADCFRSEEFSREGPIRLPGGGHPVAKFRAALETLPVSVLEQEDITEAVAPSIDLEQALFHVFGDAINLIDAELSSKRPKSRWLLSKIIGAVMGKRKAHRLNNRLRANDRTSAVFIRNNRYLITLLKRK